MTPLVAKKAIRKFSLKFSLDLLPQRKKKSLMGLWSQLQVSSLQHCMAFIVQIIDDNAIYGLGSGYLVIEKLQLLRNW